MFVDMTKAQRKLLSAEQQKFLREIVPLSALVARQTYNRCLAADPLVWTAHSISVAVFAAHCIVKSDWGAHPAATDRIYTGKTNCRGDKLFQHGNNLALVEAGENWRRPTINHGGKTFRSYKDRHDFAIDMVDRFSRQIEFRELLAERSTANQIRQMSVGESADYAPLVAKCISDYRLYDFEI